MKKAIVFGGSGFVGSHLADALTNAGIETTIFDLSPSPFISNKQSFIKGSVLDQTLVSDVLKGFDYVFHLAGQADIGVGLENPGETLSLNIQGTINILEACKKYNIERFIFASTVYVYSDTGGFYRASKQACEIIIEEYQKNYGINYTILRYGSLYGPRSGDGNFIHRLIKQAHQEKKIDVGFDMNEKREFIHVLDAARMSVKILEHEYENMHVMLTGYQLMTRRELVNIINEMMGGNLKINEGEQAIDKARGHYKFTPYVFKPKISRKLVSSSYIEFGQGILNCLEDIYETEVQCV